MSGCCCCCKKTETKEYENEIALNQQYNQENLKHDILLGEVRETFECLLTSLENMLNIENGYFKSEKSRITTIKDTKLEDTNLSNKLQQIIGIVEKTYDLIYDKSFSLKERQVTIIENFSFCFKDYGKIEKAYFIDETIKLKEEMGDFVTMLHYPESFNRKKNTYNDEFLLYPDGFPNCDNEKSDSKNSNIISLEQKNSLKIKKANTF